MLAILNSTGRVLWRHWPQLLAWYIGGIAVHYVVVQVAGFVGAFTTTVGFLILPIAILARLVSLVAMFLVVRDGLRNLEEIAPVPEEPKERRRTFRTALLAAILPFFAVYWAQGLLKDDVDAYSFQALAMRRAFVAFTPDYARSDDTVQNLPLNVWTVTIIVVAFAGRCAWTKWEDRLPRSLSPVAVYFEVVWVFYSVIVIGDLLNSINGWVDSRVAMVVFNDVREQVLDAIAPLRWVWGGIGWVLAELGPVLLAPLTWLTVAGVVYGQAIVAEKLNVNNELVDSIREHAKAIPNPIARRLNDLGKELGSRFVPIGRAVLLMWRAGPVLVASYAFLYVAVKTGESYLEVGVTRLVGPHDYLTWAVLFPFISILPQLVIEPVRISVIASAYDATLGKVRARQSSRLDAAGLSPEEAEIQAVADAAGLLPSSANAVAAAIVSAPRRDQLGGRGSTENLTNSPSVSSMATSTQNGPDASSGTT